MSGGCDGVAADGIAALRGVVKVPAASGAARPVWRRNQVGDVGDVAPQFAAHMRGALGQWEIRLRGQHGARRQVVAGVAIVAMLARGAAVLFLAARWRMLVDVVTRMRGLFVMTAIRSAGGPGGLERHHEQQEYQEQASHRVRVVR